MVAVFVDLVIFDPNAIKTDRYSDLKINIVDISIVPSKTKKLAAFIELN
jgi:hypothetical protein